MSRVLPILFNGDMVRAILDGRKTATRRVMKPQPWKIGEGEYECKHEKGFFNSGGNNWMCKQCGCGVIPMKGGSYFHAPYQPGDILYVRETWHKYRKLIGEGESLRLSEQYGYKASPANSEDADELWKPSIHMPKEAARIWLKVTDVRVERLQDISDEQAIAEGANWKNGKNVGFEEKMRRSAVERFAEIWDSTIKKPDLDKYGWKASPWVFVIEFERCERPKEKSV